MSGGVGSLSNDALLEQLRAAGMVNGIGAPARAPVSAGVSDLSDEDLMRQLGASRPPSVSRAPPVPTGGGEAASSFDERFTGPMARSLDTSTPLGAGLQKLADEKLVGKPSATNQAAAALISGSNALGLNLPRAGGALAATALAPLLGRESRSYGQNLDLAREQEEALGRQYPKTALAGTAAGIVGGAAVLPGAVTAATWPGRIRQGAALGAAYGGASELIGTGDLGKAGKAAGVGAAVGGAAVPLVDLAVKGGGALYGLMASGRPIANEAGGLTTTAQALLARQGIAPETLTPEVQARIVSAVGRKGESEGAIREALADEFGIPLSGGQATGDAQALALEGRALSGGRGSRAQEVGQRFVERQNEAIGAAGDRLAERFGGGVKLDNPAQAFEPIADQAREYATRTAREADLVQRGADDMLAQLRGPAPIDDIAAGGLVGQEFRAASDRSKAGYRAAYDDLAKLPGEFSPQAIDGLGARVANRIGQEIPIDPVLTPAASRAMADLNDARSILRLGEGEGATAQQAEILRKRMNTLSPATPMDRAALRNVRAAFGEEMDAAAGIGQFGPRASAARPSAADFQAAQRVMEAAAERGEFIGADEALRRVTERAGGAADGFPADLSGVGPAGGSGGRQREPEGLLAFLGRKGGIALDDDARAADYGRIQTGFGPLGRRNGRPIEDFRDELVSEGFIRPDDDTGVISRKIGDELHDLIGLERGGQRVLRLSDVSRGSAAPDVGGRLADDSAAYAERMGSFTRQVEADLQAVGVRPQDIDPAALRDASERLMRRQADDGAEAYEAAIMARSAGDDGARAASGAADDAPFPDLGEGVGPASSQNLPIATPEGEAYSGVSRAARKRFQDHAYQFRRRGTGDDAGAVIERIIERDLEPVDISRLIYSGNSGRDIRVANRAKEVFGEGSEGWAAYQAGYLSHVINGRDMSPKAVAARAGEALTGKGRDLTYHILGKDKAAILHDYRRAAQTAGETREGMPEWISNLSRTDFDPNRVMADMFGAGVPGARPGSTASLRGVKTFYGGESAEVSGLRYAAWQRLVMKSDGSGMLPPAKINSNIREFVDGKGRKFAGELFDTELLGTMKRYGLAVQATVRPDGTLRPNDGGAAGKIAGAAFDAVMAGIALKLGGIPAAAAAYGARLGSKGVVERLNARGARQSFEGGAPRLRPSGPTLDLKPVGVGSGLAAEYGL